MELLYLQKIFKITQDAKNIMKLTEPSQFPKWLIDDLMDDTKIKEVPN